MESNRNSIVPDLLDVDTNYKIWSSCMEDFLLSQDLWDVIEEDKPETSESTAPDSPNDIVERNWRKKNASALRAIKISCNRNFVERIVGAKTAKEAWNMLASQFSIQNDFDDIKVEDVDTVCEVYKPFVKATRDEDWSGMETFINSHPEAVTATVFRGGRTALHYASHQGLQTIAKSLVDRMEAENLVIQDENGYTALAVAASKNNNLDLLRAMVSKNSNLTSIGDERTLPVLIAAKNGRLETIDFLFENTDINFLDPDTTEASVALLIRCIDLSSFDVPLKLVRKFPKVLQQNMNDGTFPILSFAKTFSTLRDEVVNKPVPDTDWKSRYVKYTVGPSYRNFVELEPVKMDLNGAYGDKRIDGAIEFLNLVCAEVSAFDKYTLVKAVNDAMIEATRRGSIELINAMLSANPNLIWACNEKGNMFLHAVMNRRHQVFNLIYGAPDQQKDELLSYEDGSGNNIVHCVAIMPPMPTLDRFSKSPVLQTRREVNWFKEVQSLAKPHHKYKLNKDGLTPCEVFDQSHQILFQSAEKSMKNIARSCTTVGALIVAAMIAAAFSIPAGISKLSLTPVNIKQDYISALDVGSLSLSTLSVLIFLQILASSYSYEDFLFHLPKNLELGIMALFYSMIFMIYRLAIRTPFGMEAFPMIIVLWSSIHFHFRQIRVKNIFDKNTKLPEKREFRETTDNQSIVEIELSNR